MSPGEGEEAAAAAADLPNNILPSHSAEPIVPQSQNYGENGAQPTLAKRQMGKLKQERILVPREETKHRSLTLDLYL